MKKIALLVLGALLLVTALASLRWVPQGQIGVAGQGDQARVILPGLGLKPPFSTSPVLYPQKLGPVTGQAPLRTADGLALESGFRISGRLDAERVLDFHAKAAPRGEDQIMSQGAAQAIATAGALLGLDELVTERFGKLAGEHAGTLLEQVGVVDVNLEVFLDTPQMLLRLARALAPSGNVGRLRQAAERAIAEDESAWQAHTALGLALESQRDLRGAESSYLDALALRPDALEPMAQLVDIYTAVGEVERLERLLGAALQVAPRSIPHLNWLAGSSMKRGLLDRAKSIYDRALELEPDNTVILNNLGGVYLKQDRPEEALEAFRRAVEISPRDRQSLYNLGVGLCSRGLYEEGLEHLMLAHQVAPGREPILNAIARAQRALGRDSEAAVWERLAREAAPGGESAATSPQEP